MKWTAMMLPEHIQLLRAWEKEMEYRPPKEKTEWELEELQQTIQQAFIQRFPITLTIFKQEKWSVEQGIITALDSVKRQLLFETETVVSRFDLVTIQEAQVVDFYD